jgi:hypothetical protein
MGSFLPAHSNHVPPVTPEKGERDCKGAFREGWIMLGKIVVLFSGNYNKKIYKR